jgi:hydrogenase maturation protease
MEVLDRTEKSVLILGIGNLLLADEGVGIHIAQRLQKIVLPPEVEVIDGGTGGFELIAHCRGKKKIIIVDAMQVDAEPGSVFRFAPEEAAAQWPPLTSAHAGGIYELLRFCQTLVPAPEVVIYGVVPKETQRMSTQLSEIVQRQVQAIVAKIITEVNQSTEKN